MSFGRFKTGQETLSRRKTCSDTKGPEELGFLEGRDSVFSSYATNLMKSGKILAEGETPERMIERVADFFERIENKYFSYHEGRTSFINNLRRELYSKRIVPSTPILTNAGRSVNAPLSACAVPPINLRDDAQKIKKIVDSYHRNGMGTGFDFDEAENPVEMLLYLNGIAVYGLQRKEQLRPVGNMAVISVFHPKIRDFINIKNREKCRKWAFNLSVKADESFINAAKEGSTYHLKDGTEVYADELLEEMAALAWENGDPGILFLDRMNERNPLRKTRKYVSTAPCGEMGLVKGETCQFAYLNVVEFLEGDNVDYESLGRTVPLVVRLLDDAIEYNINSYEFEASKEMVSYSRKIGIGICGFSRLLGEMGVPFVSDKGREIATDILSFINYKSKEASVELAKARGPFKGFKESAYFLEGDFLSKKFGKNETGMVSERDWKLLDRVIRKYGIRNSSTVILPPTGRSALMFDTSPQAEPVFSLYMSNRGYNPELMKRLRARYEERTLIKILEDVEKSGTIQKSKYVDDETKRIFLTSTEIPYEAHISMVSAIQTYTDEGVSKTINLPNDATVHDIKDIYIKAFESGLNGITVYRDGSRENQPIPLK